MKFKSSWNSWEFILPFVFKSEKYLDDFKAWSAIVYQLIPNVEVMSEKLQKFAKLVEADEVISFLLILYIFLFFFYFRSSCLKERPSLWWPTRK